MNLASLSSFPDSPFVRKYLGSEVRTMSFVERSDILWQELAAIVADEDMQLYDLERLGDGSLRVVISKPKPKVESESAEESQEATGTGEFGSGQGGVTTGDCATVCRRLMTYFSVEGPQFGLSTEPKMEVSSPGINRSLRLPEHYEAAVGERVKVVWQKSSEDKKRSETTVGVLKVVDEECLSLVDEASGDTLDVLLNDVRKARVDFPF